MQLSNFNTSEKVLFFIFCFESYVDGTWCVSLDLNFDKYTNQFHKNNEEVVSKKHRRIFLSGILIMWNYTYWFRLSKGKLNTYWKFLSVVSVVFRRIVQREVLAQTVFLRSLIILFRFSVVCIHYWGSFYFWN